MNSLTYTRQDADTQLPVSQFIGRLLDRVVAPIVVVATEDEEIRKRIKHVLKKDETLMQFYARTGLGRSQIVTMDKEAIRQFVWRAELNNAGPDAVRPPRLRVPVKSAPDPVPNFVVTP